MPRCRAETGSGHSSEDAERQTPGRTEGERGEFKEGRKENRIDAIEEAEGKKEINVMLLKTVCVCCSIWKAAVLLQRGNIWSVGSCWSVQCSSSAA